MLLLESMSKGRSLQKNDIRPEFNSNCFELVGMKNIIIQTHLGLWHLNYDFVVLAIYFLMFLITATNMIKQRANQEMIHYNVLPILSNFQVNILLRWYFMDI